MERFFEEFFKVFKKDWDKRQINNLKIKLCEKYKFKTIPTDFDILLNCPKELLKDFRKTLRSKPTRTISGVSVVALMTKPMKCPHGKCIMCPGGVKSYFGNVPQSYTGHEPATRRAIRNNYDPYLQVFNRLEQYIILGHSIEKIELIIMGGTFPSFPWAYQKSFIASAFKAMNDFSRTFFYKDEFLINKFKEFFILPRDIEDISSQKIIKKKILKLKGKANLINEQKRNEKSRIRCVAFCIETRPDFCKEMHIKRMLELGTTRVELGVQSIYDNVLKKINRGHLIEDTIVATKRLKDNFLKVGYHIMPGLPCSSIQKDIDMFKIIFSNSRFKPDFLKIYPCQVSRGTKLYDIWKKGLYKPLTIDEAVKIIIESKRFIPEYCRVMRVQRDIPSDVLEAGVLMTNLRQKVMQEMEHNNIMCKCIRCREAGIKKQIPDLKKITFNIMHYEASDGDEFFISADDKITNTLFGFCRLRIDKKEAGIRELHVYGESLALGEKKKGSIQHIGIGKKLLGMAEKIAFKKCSSLKIISGIGAREYYKKLGYKKSGFYMVKNR
jgi:elongator complex protein 3